MRPRHRAVAVEEFHSYRHSALLRGHRASQLCNFLDVRGCTVSAFLAVLYLLAGSCAECY